MGLKIILGEENEYVQRLEKAFRADIYSEYELVCFSDKRNILAYFSLHGADVIVISGKFGLSERDFDNKVPVMYFAEQKSDQIHEIVKYQNIKGILTEIILKYNHYTKRKV